MVRVKHRYMVVEINFREKSANAPQNLNSFTLYDSIIKKIQQLHGDYGVALVKAGFMAKYCNKITRIAILKSRHASYKILLSSLPFVNKLNDKVAVLNTLYLGATLKQCFKFITNYQMDKLRECYSKLKTQADKDAFENALMDFKSFLKDENNDE